jgi:hypothetical protein
MVSTLALGLMKFDAPTISARQTADSCDEKTYVTNLLGGGSAGRLAHYVISSLLKNPAHSEAEDRKESGSVALGTNHSPLSSFTNQSCYEVGSENLFPQTAKRAVLLRGCSGRCGLT